MSLLEAYSSLNVFCISCVFILTYLLFVSRKFVNNIYEIIFFSICIICHLLLTGYLNIRYTIVFWVLMAGASFIPLATWFLTRSLTNAPKMMKKNVLLMVLLLLCCNCALNTWDLYSGPRYPDILMSIISLGFMGHSLLLIFQSDSIKKAISEKKERKVFLFCVVGIIVISLMSELALERHQFIYLFILQRLFIIGLTVYFLATTFSLKEGIIRKKSLETVKKDPELAEKIEDAVMFEKLFLHEGLTIAKLSEIISEKEYKVRHAIIHDLGFKNFTDFINSFRIKEASKILTKPGNEGLSILEIAFHVGFSSIGPFNRAFKICTGLTPSQFRNAERQSESNLVTV